MAIVDKEVVGAELLNTYLVGAANGRLTIVQMLEGDLAGSEYVIRGLEYPEVKIVHVSLDDESEWTHISNLEFVRYENDPEKHPLLVAWKENPGKRIVVALACDPQQKPVGWISHVDVNCVEVIVFDGDDNGKYAPDDYELDDLVILNITDHPQKAKPKPEPVLPKFFLGISDIDTWAEQIIAEDDGASAMEIVHRMLPDLIERVHGYLNDSPKYYSHGGLSYMGEQFGLASASDADWA